MQNVHLATNESNYQIRFLQFFINVVQIFASIKCAQLVFMRVASQFDSTKNPHSPADPVLLIVPAHFVPPPHHVTDQASAISDYHWLPSRLQSNPLPMIIKARITQRHLQSVRIFVQL